VARRPRFLAGTALFLTGFAVNLWADRGPHRAATPREGIRHPASGLFHYVFLPELPGGNRRLARLGGRDLEPRRGGFAVWTLANLVPRALVHHRWYRARFPDYPRERHALFPGLL